MEKGRQTFDDFSRKIIVKEFTGTNAENCVGDYLQDSKNAFTCFECDRSEDIRYCMCVYDTKSSMDFSYWGGNAEKTYCILNKQYTKEEYEKLIPRIIEHMRSTPLRSDGATAGQAGEWGEFFPVNKSIYAYNESLAQEQIPLTKKETLAKGWQWHDEEEEQTKKYMGPTVELPDSIRDASDDVTANILTSVASGKPYKI